MGGAIAVRGEVAWIGSFGPYDVIMGRVRKVAEGNEAHSIAQMISDATEPNQPYLDIRCIDQQEFNAFWRAAESAYEQFCADGPNGYGGTPEAYDRVQTQFGELLKALRTDPRARSG